MSTFATVMVVVLLGAGAACLRPSSAPSNHSAGAVTVVVGKMRIWLGVRE